MRLVAWAIGFALLLGLAGWLVVTPSDAFAKADAIDSGTAPVVESTLSAGQKKDVRRRTNNSKLRTKGPWGATCNPVDPDVVVRDTPIFRVADDGEVLGQWDGKTVSCHLWTDRTVIAVEGPDGTLLKGSDVGWTGAISRWLAAAFALGGALLIGGSRLKFGVVVAIAGGGLMALVAGIALIVKLF